MRKVLIFGIDGATFDILECEEFEFPNIRKLIAEGVKAPFRSVFPPITFTAWPSIFTGVNPGKHGIFGFGVLGEDGRKKPFGVHDLKVKTLWEYAGEAGRKVCVLNVPVTYPAFPVNGIMISGWPVPLQGLEKGVCYPRELIREYPVLANPYIYIYPVSTYYRDPNRVVTTLREIENTWKRVMIELYEKEEWDVFVIVFRSTDIIQHLYLHAFDPEHPFYEASKEKIWKSAIYEVFREIDDALGLLMERVSPDTHIYVISDHGLETIRIEISTFLLFKEWGLLRFVSPREMLYRKLFLKAEGKKGIKKKMLELMAKVAQRLPEWISQGILYLRNPNADFLNIDWERTLAYQIGVMEGIYLNLRGREKWGVVEEEKKEELIEEIITRFRMLNKEKRIIKRVVRRDEVHSGPYIHLSPEIYVECEPHVLLSNAPVRFRDLFKRPSVGPVNNRTLPAYHSTLGIFIAWGEGIKKGKTLEEIHLVDFAPTVMSDLGLPVPEEMDGRVRKEIFIKSPEIKFKNIPIYVDRRNTEFSDEEILQMREQLRALGYI